MKKSLYFVFGLLLVCGMYQACAPEELPGSIYGTVVDKATGEPIKSAGVELSPSGLKTVTGSEGQFEFTELDPGKYTLIITKTGYVDGVSGTIEVKPGQQAKGDVQIEQIPPALKVVDETNEDLLELHFGDAESDVARSFNIYNDGAEKLSWEIVKTAVWIDSLSKTTGELSPNAKQAVVVTIDRNKLEEGENKTTLQITSSNGSKSLTIIAINNRKAIALNTLECTDVKGTTAVFNAEMLHEGNPKYTERGFVYATQQQPTVENTIIKLTAPVNENLQFSVQAVDLAAKTTYYVRAYAINALGTVYSTNQVSFVVQTAAPSVVTDAIKDLNIENGTAIFNGQVTYVGDPTYTERGFVYGIVPNPTIDDTKKVVSGTGEGAFSANITGLEEGNIYYVRAYAQNVKSVSYGKDVVVNCVATMPKVSTNEVTNISIKNGTATFVGDVKSYGDLSCAERGFVYALTNNPTIDDTKLTVSGAELGVFRKNVSGLEEGKTYYVRAYVTNKKGTVYGNEVSCNLTANMPEVKTLAVTNKEIAKGTATFNGTVVSLGDLGYTEKGFAYGVAHNPTIDNSKVTSSGEGIGDFFATASELVEGKTYYIRAYVTNSKGTVYGEEVEMDYTAGMPEVKTLEVTNKNIGTGTATFKGSILSLGDLGYTERGFAYATVHNPTIGDSKIKAEGSGTGEFSATASALVEGNTYYVRAYATNSKSTVYGEEIEMDYTAVMPVVKTVSVVSKNIAEGVATFKGEVVSLGDLGYTERGFVYATVHNPTIGDTKAIAEGIGTGDFSATASALVEGNTYYIRAYATNSKSTVYGEEIEMDYTATMPVVKTVSVVSKNIAEGVATFKGNVVSLGDLACTERGFVYGIVHNPTIDDSKITASGSGTGDFTATASQLHEGKTYYIRAFVTNKKGTVYGEEITMDYTAGKTVVQTLEVISKNFVASTATFKGSIISLSELGYSERGFVYSTVHNPTLGDTKTIAEGSGSGEFSATGSELTEGRTYYIRAYATNSKETVYGGEIEMDYTAVMPVIKTVSVVNKNIAAGTATFKGNVVSLGDLPYTERGFVYGIVHNPTTDDSKITASGSGTGDFTATASQLQEGQTYYIRAFVTNKKGTVYGEEIEMDYTAIMPVIQTVSIIDKNIAEGIAVIKGNVVSLGDLICVERGFVYAVVQNPTINDTKVIASGVGVGEYTEKINGLISGNIYYIRAYVSNNKGVVYGENLKLDFNPIVYSPITKNITNISTTTAVLNAEIDEVGDPPFTEKGFVYSKSNNPQVSTAYSVSIDGIAKGGYYATINNLEAGETYYVNSYVKYPNTILYGEEISFSTLIDVFGKIVDVNNVPIEGANVKITGTTTKTVTTNAEGEFTIESISQANAYKLTITAEGYQTYEKSNVYFTKNNNNIYQLEQFGKLTGVVKDEIGTLLKNVTVTLGNKRCTTDQNGKFTFTNLNSGSYTIKATKSNYTTDSKNIQVQPGENNVELIIDPNIELEVSQSWIDFACYPESEGTTTTTIRLKNNRDCEVQYDLSNLPSKGLTISPTKGSIQPNSSANITITLTYPTENNSNVVRYTTPQIIDGVKYYKVYLWQWDEIGLYNDGVTYYCRQTLNLSVSPSANTSKTIVVNLSQYTIWSD